MKQLQQCMMAVGILCLTFTMGFAQQSDDPESQTEKKVVVIKKTVDDDGNTTTEKIIAEGTKADALLKELESEKGDQKVIIIENDSGDKKHVRRNVWIEKENDEGEERNVEVDVTDEDGHRTITIRRDGGEPEVIELKEGEELPEEDRERLHEEGIFIMDSESGPMHHSIENIEVELENVDGESYVVIRKMHDGEEEVIRLGGLEGDLEALEGELAKMRIRRSGQAECNAFMNKVHVEDRMTNCAALGVYVGTNGDQVRISSIIGESGAEAAGLQAGDIIHTINGEEVRNFKELRHALSAYFPGDVVTVTYSRGDEKGSIDTQLKSWKDLPSMQDSYLAKVVCDIENIDDAGEANQFLAESEDPLSPKDGGVIGTNVSPLNSLQLNDFEMYPNPTDGKVRVRFKADPEATLVKVMDQSGKELFRRDLKEFDGHYDEEIDLTGLARGSFILMIEQEGNIFSEQIAVQ